MLTKPLLALILAACGVSSTSATADPPAEEPGEFEPTEPAIKPTDSHWCCQSVDFKTMSGEGCNAFSGSIELINACAKYLYCEGNAVKDDGKVQCQ